MPEIKKYRISLKYKGYPEFKIETTANSDEEAVGKLTEQIHDQYPDLKNQKPLSSNILKSNDPY